MQTAIATNNLDLLAAAARVAAACTPRRRVTLRDEFGPIRGRRFLTAPTAVADLDTDELGRQPSRRSTIAWEVAC
jgi:hypothetical protein